MDQLKWSGVMRAEGPEALERSTSGVQTIMTTTAIIMKNHKLTSACVFDEDDDEEGGAGGDEGPAEDQAETVKSEAAEDVDSKAPTGGKSLCRLCCNDKISNFNNE